jgi:hypothetical protein
VPDDLIALTAHRIAGMPPSQFIEFCIVLACLVAANVIIVRSLIREDRDERRFARERAGLEAAHQERMRRMRGESAERREPRCPPVT